MELTQKTTILFPPDLYSFLVELGRRQRKSVGELVRTACEQQYRHAGEAERRDAADALSAMSLPVDDVEVMMTQATHRRVPD